MAEPSGPAAAVIALTEFEAGEAALAPAALLALRARYARQIDIAPTEQAGVYRLMARGHVGRISLPGGAMLIIRPRVGVANLFYLLTGDPSLARFAPPPAGLAPNPEIFGFVMAMLIDRVERLLGAGLQQDYVAHEDDLPFVRGRIVLGAQLRRHGELKDRHVCAYTAFTVDTAENRIVAATLRLLPTLLIPAGERALARRARAVLARFAGVTALSRGDALALLPRIGFHRFNAAYAPVLSLCRLALRHLTLAEAPGPHPFASFLVDMPRLFESFVAARLRAGLRAHGLRVVAQRWDYLDEGRRVGIRPDVLVYPAHGADPLLVLDTKYERLGPHGDAALNSDIYQVSAYLDRYRLQRGALVFPRFEPGADADLKLLGAPRWLRLVTLDLAAPTVAALECECARLVEQVAALALAPA
jgi:5-methylcytosine-specific restriction enzyme subunit McrC